MERNHARHQVVKAKERAMRKTILMSLIFILFITPLADAFWIWSPKTGKWVNPKQAVESTPVFQLDYALRFYEKGELKKAQSEFKKLLKCFPKSNEAAEAQFYLGAIEEKGGRLYDAYLAYQKVIDKYPFSSRINEIIEKEFKIAERFMQGERRKALGIALLVENPAIEIFRHVVANSTYGQWADDAQYNLGLVLKRLGYYLEAEDEFNKVIANYPESEWVGSAQFQIASCRASVSVSSDYDQEATREAKEKFEEFLHSHPDTPLSVQAESNLQELREKEAQSYYEIAVFYEKQRLYPAAKIYYNIVVENYPQSQWATKSLLNLQVLEQKPGDS